MELGDSAETSPLGLIFEDPISFELMENAVVTECGHSFSEQTLTEWMASRDECPICQAKLSKKSVFPNYKLREIISKYQKYKKERNKRLALNAIARRAASEVKPSSTDGQLRSQSFAGTPSTAVSSSSLNLSDWDVISGNLSDSDEEEDGPTLIVDVLQAKELAKREWGKTDPFCLLEVAESCRQTRVIKRNFKNPQWRESFLFHVKEPAKSFFELTIYTGTHFLGYMSIPVAELVKSKKLCKWFPLQKQNPSEDHNKKKKKKKSSNKVKGQVKLRFRYLPSLNPKEEVSSMTPRTKALADEYCEFGALPSSPLQGATEEQLQEDARRRQETDSNENREIEPEADQPPPPQQQEVQPDVSNGFQEAVQHDMEDNGEDVAAVPEPSEALIGRLMIHGIDRETAIHTLQASNNDLDFAIRILFE